MIRQRHIQKMLCFKTSCRIGILVLGACGLLVQATQAVTAEEEAFQRFREGTFDLVTLAAVLPQMADATRRAEIRQGILESQSAPRAELVALLDYPMLAVRLGALELLEEMAGGDFDYNPWDTAKSPANIEAHKLWKAWAGKPDGSAISSAIFSEDQRRGYLRDLLAEDGDKAARARRMLEAEGLAAVGFLETFLQKTPTLSAVGRTRVRQAQYQITLARQLGDQASVCARNLAFGSRDQLLAAMTTVRGAGLFAIPILQDFIRHPDPLVREVSVDALLATGGQDALPVVGPLLAQEVDVNVIHGALRWLKEIRNQKSYEIIISLLDREDEDLRVAAIQACKLFEDEPYAASMAKEPIMKCLSDPRWRVKASALDYVEACKMLSANDRCIDLLDDEDDFVRFAAVKAAAAVGGAHALTKLKEMLAKDPRIVGLVIEAYSKAKTKPDAQIVEILDKSPKEARIIALRAVRSNPLMQDLLLRYSMDKDLDVASAALRSIASDGDLVQKNAFASVLVHALRSDNKELEIAICEQLNMPDGSSRGLPQHLVDAMTALGPDQPSPTLDPLYAAFHVNTPAVSGSDFAAGVPVIPSADKELLKELVKRCSEQTPAEIRILAATHLANIGNGTAYPCLLKDLPSLNTAQKIKVCYSLRNATSTLALPLIKAILRDPVAEVREAAANCALSAETDKVQVGLVLAELEDPNGKLSAVEAYNNQFDDVVQKQPVLFREWSLRVLKSEKSSVPMKVLATIAARHCASDEHIEILRALTSSADVNMRRAAWHALVFARPKELPAQAQAITADPEAFVRVVFPQRIGVERFLWEHHFSDAKALRDHYYQYSQNKAPKPDADACAILRRLATQDPSPLIRFEASMAMLAVGEPVGAHDLAALVPSLPEDAKAAYRLTEWMEQNAARATPAMRPLLAVLDVRSINDEKLKLLKSRIMPKGAKSLFDFAELAKVEDGDTPNEALLITGTTEKPASDRTSLKLIFFHKPGCSECTTTRQLLESVHDDFPMLDVSEINILDPEGTELNQALCSRFSVPSNQYGVAPVVFTQNGFVVGRDLSRITLSKLLASTMDLPQDDAWLVLDKQHQEQAARAVEDRYQNITLSIVILGGLLDGINPCAFATIIFFLSYLQIARRTPREMLLVGIAFISAVFIAYLAAGLVLHEVLAALSDQFAGVQRWMNYGFGALALVAAMLSLRDARLAHAGRMGEMALQLPGALKERIRKVIRVGARARNFIIAAFISGLIISLLELACTGQVYAPIIYQIQKGRLDAVWWLVIYNLAFIMPLIAIFILAYSGVRSETLAAFQKKHTFGVKLALAALFLGLALLIFMGS